MRFFRIIAPVCAGILVCSAFWGCAGGPAPVEETPSPPVSESKPEPEVSPQIVDGASAALPAQPAADSEFSLQPIDRRIVYQVIEGGDSLKKLQYYISETVTLVQENVMRSIEIRQGAGLRRETSATGQIVIQKETPGVLVNTFFDSDKRRILAVSFDETSDRNTLFFREDNVSRRFVLMYDAKSYLTGYGDRQYLLNFNGDVPHLLIRFSEEKTSVPSERVVRGRFLSTEN
ncbi:MAG: hypothetical protein LBQ57_06615 [Spirochaetales bacterium]|jgi:hypothetical protein|nr:hypothetical protein [Spirochaetales bacterium]